MQLADWLAWQLSCLLTFALIACLCFLVYMCVRVFAYLRLLLGLGLCVLCCMVACSGDGAHTCFDYVWSSDHAWCA